MNTSTTCLLILTDAAAKSAAVLLLARGASIAMRRASAAARHMVWTAAIAIALLLPIASALLPAYRLAVLPARYVSAIAPAPVPLPQPVSPPPHQAPPNDAPPSKMVPLAKSNGDSHLLPLDQPNTIPHSPPLPLHKIPVRPPIVLTPLPTNVTPTIAPPTYRQMMIALIVTYTWLAGAALLIARWLIGLLAAWQLTRRSTATSDGPIFNLLHSIQQELCIHRHVQLRISDRIAMPLATGTLQPTLLLPSAAATWPSEQLRSVLLHELAHVKRFDCATQSLAQLACAMYWFNPLLWLAAARLRIERERACDDLVIAHGPSPANYAQHLLAIAKAIGNRRMPNLSALGMARPAGLRRRVTDILDSTLNHRALSSKLALTAITLAALLLLPLGALHLSPRTAKAAATPPITHRSPTTHPSKLLRLTVLDKTTGKPIANASVDFDGEPNNGHTTTDSHAQATINFASSNHPWLTVRRANFVPITVDWTRGPHPKIPPPTYTLRLPPGTTIGGKVIDDAGKPIAGAHVAVYVNVPHSLRSLEHMDINDLDTLSKADGTWSFTLIPAKVNFIDVGAWDNRYVTSDDGSDFYNGPHFTNVQPLRDGTTTLTLQSGIAVTGVVLGSNGKPLAGARVGYGADRVASNAVPWFITKGDGKFSFAFKPGTTVVLTTMAKHYAPAMLTTVVVKDAKPITFHMMRAHRLAGRVMDSNGKPISNVDVVLDTWRGNRTLGDYTLYTSADGRFHWDDAPADTIYAYVGGPHKNWGGRTSVPLVAGQPNIVVLQPMLHITGTVTDAVTGKPIPTFSLQQGSSFNDQPPTFDLRETSTHHNGSFAFTPTYPYPAYAVRIQAKGYLTTDSRAFTPSEHNVHLNIKLQPAADWKPRVLLPNGKPAANVTATLVVPLSAYNFNGDVPPAYPDQEHQHFTTDANGALDIPAQSTQAIIVVTAPAGYGQANQDVLKNNGIIQLQPWAKVHGKLMIQDKPGKDQTVMLGQGADHLLDDKLPQVHSAISAKTDAQGRFTMNHVPPGKATISRHITRFLGHYGTSFDTEQKTLNLKPGQITNVTIGGGGRMIVGQLIVPPELAKERDWMWNYSNELVTAAPPPKLPIPKDVMSWPRAKRMKWYKKFLKSDANKAYIAKQMKWNDDHKRYPLEVSTDAHFHVTDVPAGTYKLSASIIKLTSSRSMEQIFLGRDSIAQGSALVVVPPIKPGQTAVPLHIPLVVLKMVKVNNATTQASATTHPSKLLHLAVLDKTTGKPIANAGVDFDGEPNNGHTTTDSHGHATINFVSSNHPWITVRHANFVPISVDWTRGPHPKSLPSTYILRLPPGTTIGGKVIDDAGKPIAGAHVVIYVKAPHAPSPLEHVDIVYLNTRSKADGTWSFNFIPSKIDTIDLGVWDYHYVTNEGGHGYYNMPGYSNVQALRDRTATFTLPRGVSVSGVVLGPNGKPLAGARVGYGPDRVASNVVPWFTTKADGKFSFAFQPGTTVVLTALANHCSPEMLTTVAAIHAKPIVFHMTPGHHLAGRVIGSNGKPIDHAYIWLDTWRGKRTLGDSTLRTNADGHFHWNDAPADSVAADIVGNGWMRREVVPLVAGKPNIVVLKRPLHVTGTVTDAVTGKPIPTFRLEHGIVFNGRPPTFEMRQTSTYHNGTFAFSPDFPYPAYAVRIVAHGYLTADSRSFTDSERNVHLQLKLQPAADWKPKVLLPNGKPAANVTATLVVPENPYDFQGQVMSKYTDQAHQQFTTAADGALDIPPLSTQAMVVVIAPAGYATANQNVLKKDGVIQLQAWARVQGKLMIQNSPGKYQTVFLSQWMGAPYDDGKGPQVRTQINAQTDAQGRFTMNHVPPGQATISRRIEHAVSRFGTIFETDQKTLDLKPGQSINLTLGGGGRLVEGQLKVPPALASKHDWMWSFNSQLATATPPPKLPISKEVRNGPRAQQRKWYKSFRNSGAYTAYVAALTAWEKNRKQYPLEVSDNGQFRVPDVLAGIYTLSASISKRSVHATGLGQGEPIAQGSTTVIVPPIKPGQTAIPLHIPPVVLTMLHTVNVGDAAPDFTVKSLDGQPINLKSIRGKFVLLDFWASWCGPCVAETPSLQAVYTVFGHNPRFAMLGLSLDQKPADAANYATKNKLPWLQAFLPDGFTNPVTKAYGVTAIPSTWLISPDGKVIAKDLTGERIKTTIEEALAAVTATQPTSSGKAASGAPGASFIPPSGEFDTNSLLLKSQCQSRI